MELVVAVAMAAAVVACWGEMGGHTFHAYRQWVELHQEGVEPAAETSVAMVAAAADPLNNTNEQHKP